MNVLVTALVRPAEMAQFSAAQWDTLIRLARASDLTARLASLAREQGVWAQLPVGPRKYLRAAELMCVRQHVELGYEVRALWMALASLNVPVVLLKGAAYVRAGMDAGRGRMVGDVDILVPHASLADVESQLLLNGWLSSAKSAYDQRYYRQWMHELPPMMHMKRGTVLDVHHAILPTTARLHPSSAKLLQAALPLNDGTGLLRLSPLDMVLHSATHLMHEGEFEQGMRGLVDLVALMQPFVRGEQAWPDLVARAQELELGRPLMYALRQVRRHLGLVVPQDVMAVLMAQPGVDPGRCALGWMDAMWDRVLRAPHPMVDDRWSGLAREFMYLRGHWLRMPPGLLVIHLTRKAFLSSKPPEEPERREDV